MTTANHPVQPTRPEMIHRISAQPTATPEWIHDAIALADAARKAEALAAVFAERRIAPPEFTEQAETFYDETVELLLKAIPSPEDFRRRDAA